MQNRRRVGTNYENLAAKYLQTLGYQIIEQNYYSRYGEIDLIAIHQGYLVFVEVKYRTDEKKGNPLEAVTLSKQKAISKSAVCYMREHRMESCAVRFDVVGILGEKIKVISNAFEFVS